MIYFATNQKRIVTLCNINHTQDGFYHPDRIMPEYDLLYLRKGSWEIWEEDALYSLNAGEVLILEPNLHHYSLQKCTVPMNNIFIHCSSSPADYSPRRPLHTTASKLPHEEYICVPKQTNCSGNPQIERLFLQIMEAHLNPSEYNTLRIHALMELLLIELAATGNEQCNTDPLIQEIIHSFYQYSNRFFSPKELAEAYHVSIRTLSSRFKGATGTSIHRYQMDLKLNIAREQLPLYPKRRLADLALSLGFYDEFHFSKLFKRKFGFSPSENFRS